MGALISAPSHDFPPFSPSGIFSSAHVQTICAGLPVLRSARSRVLRQSFQVPLAVPGEDSESLYAEALMQPTGARPLALLVHGMAGSMQSAYLRRASRAVVDAGFHTASVDLRGSGRSKPTSLTIYHAGMVDDLNATLEHLAHDSRVSSILLVGFSLGGQASLLAASLWGEKPPPKVRGVVAVCPPLDLAETSRRIEDWRVYPYKTYVLRGLINNAKSLKERAPNRVPLTMTELDRIARIRDFDERVIAPMHGFSSAADYYEKVGSGPRLGAIRLPTLIMGAEDDPMVPGETMRPFVETASPSVKLVLTKKGGHLGYVERARDGLSLTWSNRRILERLAEID